MRHTDREKLRHSPYLSMYDRSLFKRNVWRDQLLRFFAHAFRIGLPPPSRTETPSKYARFSTPSNRSRERILSDSNRPHAFLWDGSIIYARSPTPPEQLAASSALDVKSRGRCSARNHSRQTSRKDHRMYKYRVGSWRSGESMSALEDEVTVHPAVEQFASRSPRFGESVKKGRRMLRSRRWTRRPLSWNESACSYQISENIFRARRSSRSFETYAVGTQSISRVLASIEERASRYGVQT